MKICEENKVVSEEPFWIDGNIYKLIEPMFNFKSGEIFLACDSKHLHSLESGKNWDITLTYSACPEWWINVTDQYCLKKVK